MGSHKSKSLHTHVDVSTNTSKVKYINNESYNREKSLSPRKKKNKDNKCHVLLYVPSECDGHVPGIDFFDVVTKGLTTDEKDNLVLVYINSGYDYSGLLELLDIRVNSIIIEKDDIKSSVISKYVELLDKYRFKKLLILLKDLHSNIPLELINITRDRNIPIDTYIHGRLSKRRSMYKIAKLLDMPQPSNIMAYN